MARLALYLLGMPRIERDGAPVIVDTRKAVALVAYLAVTRQVHSRDTLVTLLWPDYDQPNARAALRRTLWALNNTPVADWLVIDRESLGLNLHADLWCDVTDFWRSLTECQAHGHAPSEVCPACVEPLTHAVTVYQGDFLAGFNLRDSPSFDDWQLYQADTLRRELSGALERLARCYSTLGEFGTAITYARRWLALDRLHEPAHRQLMQLYTWAGQRTAALQQYRECVQVLNQELGVAPLEETTRLSQAIKENQSLPLPAFSHAGREGSAAESGGRQGGAAARQAPGPTPPSSSSFSAPALPPGLPTPPAPSAAPAPGYPLAGRGREFAELLGAYKAIGTAGALLILRGEAGIGKTRLADEFMAYAGAKGARIVAARCYEGEAHLAYEPLMSALRSALAERDTSWVEALPARWLSEAARLLPELASLKAGLAPAPQLDSPGAQGRFFEGLRHVLFALCDGHAHVETDHAPPGIVFFDDIQWADSATFDFLSYLARRMREQPLCLLLTWRTSQEANGTHLQRLLAEAQRAGTATVIELQRLSQADVEALVQAASGGMRLPGDFARRLYEETEGLPFFLVEYLKAVEKGSLVAEQEGWALPGGVRDLLQSRLANVSETGWQLLSTAAVIGRSFDFDTLREASGRSEEEAVAGLEELMAKGLVEEVRGATGEGALSYDFSHEKLREIVYEETSLARRRLLHRRVAEVMVSRHARGRRESGLLAGQIAQQYRFAGNEQLAAKYFKLAGEHARALYAHAQALEHFRMALALGHAEEAALHEASGDMQVLLGDYRGALKSYETAAALSEASHLSTLEYKLGGVYSRLSQWELAESHFTAALNAQGEDGPAGERARISAELSLVAHHLGHFERAQELARQSLALAESAHDTLALAQAHNLLGMLASDAGDFALARQHLERSLSLSTLSGEDDDPTARVAALNNLALVYKASGDWEQALELTKSALALCGHVGDRHREAALHSNLADLLHALGRAEEAMSHLKQSASIFSEIGGEPGTLQPEIWKLVAW